MNVEKRKFLTEHSEEIRRLDGQDLNSVVRETGFVGTNYTASVPDHLRQRVDKLLRESQKHGFFPYYEGFTQTNDKWHVAHSPTFNAQTFLSDLKYLRDECDEAVRASQVPPPAVPIWKSREFWFATAVTAIVGALAGWGITRLFDHFFPDSSPNTQSERAADDSQPKVGPPKDESKVSGSAK